MIVEALLIILVFLSAFIVHEIGHHVYIVKILKRKVTGHFTKTGFYWMYDDDGLNNRQKTGVYMSGILFGLIPLIIFFEFNFFNDTGHLIMLGGYFGGCIRDIHGIIGLMRK